MTRYFLVLFLVLVSPLLAQQKQKTDVPLLEETLIEKRSDVVSATVDSLKTASSDSLVNILKNKSVKLKKKRKPLPYIKPMDSVTIADYKIMYMDRKTEIVDTSLTVFKDYKFNFLRHDYFELLSFPNVGETFNKLGYDFHNAKPMPQLGARAKHFGYFEKEDIPYFEVPSPLTELFFKTTFGQGQLLNALITVNTSPRFNFTLSHRGFRSLGKYISSRSGAQQFRFSSQYQSYNKRYRLRLHFASQKLENQVNGGLTDGAVYRFENAPNYPVLDEEGAPVLNEDGTLVMERYTGFLDRSRLTTQLRGSNVLSGNRYFIDQRYGLLKADGGTYKLEIGHNFTYEPKHYKFNQNHVSKDFLGEAYADKIADHSQLRLTENNLYANFRSRIFGTLNFVLHSNSWRYFFGEDEYSTEKKTNNIKTNQLAVSSYWRKSILYFDTKVSVYKSLKNDFAATMLSVALSRSISENIFFSSEYQFRKQPLNFNFYLYHSDYKDYNWNRRDFNEQNFSTFSLTFGHSKWGNVSAQWNVLQNYAYFKNTTPSDELNKKFSVAPLQAENKINYYKLRFFQKLDLGKFSFVNTVQYQQINQATSIGRLSSEPLALNVPKWIARSTVMFSTLLFEKALYSQSGITFRFFTNYYADMYNPVVGEFVTQNNVKIGDYPRVDVFFNAKIKQIRLFFKLEHINSQITGYNYYSAPFTPYRDFAVRFGLAWNFFQ